MNYWTFHKEIGGSTMMMLLSWLYHLKEEFGSHQGSTYENFIQKSIFHTGVIAVQFSGRDILQAVRKALLLINFLGPFSPFFLFSFSYSISIQLIGETQMVLAKRLMLDIIKT